MLDPLTNNYPLAIANIINKPLICYQLEYLQKHGIQEVFITIEKKFAYKVEKYIRNYF